jgi:hypothetical protein
MVVESNKVNEIIHTLVNNYIEKEENPLTPKTEFKFKEVVDQLKDLVESSQNYEDIQDIQDILVLLEKEVVDPDLKVQIKSVADIAARNVTSIAQASPKKVKSIKDTLKTLTFSERVDPNFDFLGQGNLKGLVLKNCIGLTAEQFNSIPNKASIETLDLSGVYIEDFDFSGFTSLKVALFGGSKLTPEQFNSIPNKASIETLDLEAVNIEGFDLSGLASLKVAIVGGNKLTPEQFNAIPNKASIESLKLKRANCKDFDFSGFTNLKTLKFINCSESSLSATQFGAIPNKASIKNLVMSSLWLTDFDFSEFAGLEELSLKKCYGLTETQLNSILTESKSSIKKLNLESFDLKDFDFSGFTSLESLNLERTKNLTSELFNSIPEKAKASIKRLNLNRAGSVSGFDFSGFTALQHLDVYSSDLTAKQLSEFSSEAKASIETINLGEMSVEGFDFSGFTNLKEFVDGEDVYDLTPEVFNSISPQTKASIEVLNLCNTDVKGFDFSGFTSLKTLDLEGAKGLIAEQFNAIPNKDSIRTLNLNGVDITGFDFSGFTNLKSLNLNESAGLTAEQFNSIPNKGSIETLNLMHVNVTGFDFSACKSLKNLKFRTLSNLTENEFNTFSLEGETSVEILDLKFMDVTDFNFSGFKSLKTLELNEVQNLTADQFNAISSEAKASIKVLKLRGVDVTGFDFSGFTGLKTLDLKNAQGSISLPENIGEFISLRSLSLNRCRELTSLPTSITNLSNDCTIDISGSGLSETVRERLQETANTEGYQGPRFIFSMEHLNPQNNDIRTVKDLLTNVYSLASMEQPSLENLPKDEESLKNWLSRLSYMADYNVGGERQEKLAKSVVNYLEKANDDSDFKNTFLAVINDAAETCGDRMALSVINLSIAHQIQTNDLSDMKSLAHLLSRGVWAMGTLENIAREKVKSLPFVDEVEVYLGYPTMLKETLELPINIGEMLYFACSGITGRDLDMAEELVKDQLNNGESLNEFLLGHDKWIEALNKNNPEEMKSLERTKEQAKEAYSDDQLDEAGYLEAEKSYKQGIADLTTKVLA